MNAVVFQNNLRATTMEVAGGQLWWNFSQDDLYHCGCFVTHEVNFSPTTTVGSPYVTSPWFDNKVMKI